MKREPGWLLHRKVAGLGSLEDFNDKSGDLSESSQEARSIRHETAFVRCLRPLVDRGHTKLPREMDNSPSYRAKRNADDRTFTPATPFAFASRSARSRSSGAVIVASSKVRPSAFAVALRAGLDSRCVVGSARSSMVLRG